MNSQGPSKIVLKNLFVITVKILKFYVLTCRLGPNNQQHFVRYKYEFLITVILKTEFDCTFMDILNIVCRKEQQNIFSFISF